MIDKCTCIECVNSDEACNNDCPELSECLGCMESKELISELEFEYACAEGSI